MSVLYPDLGRTDKPLNHPTFSTKLSTSLKIFF